MLLSCRKLRLTSTSYFFNCRFNRYCILDAVFYSFYTTDCIRMSLTYTFSPECVSASLY